DPQLLRRPVKVLLRVGHRYQVPLTVVENPHRLSLNLAGTTGFEPATSAVTGQRSRPSELRPHWKPRGESNPRIKTLQVSPLPLGYAAYIENWWTRGELPSLCLQGRRIPVMLAAHMLHQTWR